MECTILLSGTQAALAAANLVSERVHTLERCSERCSAGAKFYTRLQHACAVGTSRAINSAHRHVTSCVWRHLAQNLSVSRSLKIQAARNWKTLHEVTSHTRRHTPVGGAYGPVGPDCACELQPSVKFCASRTALRYYVRDLCQWLYKDDGRRVARRRQIKSNGAPGQLTAGPGTIPRAASAWRGRPVGGAAAAATAAEV